MYRSTISFICALFIVFTWILNQEVISSEKGKSLWSLKKISSVEPPIIEEDSWSSNAIDKFILKRLKDNNIKQINNWLTACIDKIVNGEENYDSNNFLNKIYKQKNDIKIKELCI